MALTSKTLKIFIADRSLLFRSGLKVLLSSEPDMTIVGEAGDIPEALLKSSACRPDVLVVDSSLTGDVPAPMLREAKCSVLLLVKEGSDEELQLAMQAGARAYILKDSAPAELIVGIRQLALTGDRELVGLSRLVPDLHALGASVGQGQRPADLTLREQEVMRLLANGHTARQAAAELGLSVKTIEAHKLNLMRKLGIHDRLSLIASAIAAGLVSS